MAGGDGPTGVRDRSRADFRPDRAVWGPPGEGDRAGNGSPALLGERLARPRRSRKGNLQGNPPERLDLLERGRPVERAGRRRAACTGAVPVRAVPVVRVRGSRARGLVVEYRADACARVRPRGL